MSSRSSSGNKANISDRLNSIMSNSESWKSKRGKQNDATQFTTEAKIAQRGGTRNDVFITFQTFLFQLPTVYDFRLLVFFFDFIVFFTVGNIIEITSG